MQNSSKSLESLLSSTQSSFESLKSSSHEGEDESHPSMINGKEIDVNEFHKVTTLMKTIPELKDNLNIFQDKKLGIVDMVDKNELICNPVFIHQLI